MFPCEGEVQSVQAHRRGTNHLTYVLSLPRVNDVLLDMHGLRSQSKFILGVTLTTSFADAKNLIDRCLFNFSKKSLLSIFSMSFAGINC